MEVFESRFLGRGRVLFLDSGPSRDGMLAQTNKARRMWPVLMALRRTACRGNGPASSRRRGRPRTDRVAAPWSRWQVRGSPTTAVCGFESPGYTSLTDGGSPRQHRVAVAADVVSGFSVPAENSSFPGASAMATAGHYSSGQCYAIHTDIEASVGFGFAIQRRAPFENESFVGPLCESWFRGGPDPSKQ